MRFERLRRAWCDDVQGLRGDDIAGVRDLYDALPDDPLTGEPVEVALARAALVRVDLPPWGPHVRAGLAATAQIVNAVAPFADATALLSRE